MFCSPSYADVNSIAKDSGAALMFAANRGHTEVVKELIQARADLNPKSKGMTALMLATKGGHTEVVKELIQAGAGVNSKVK